MYGVTAKGAHAILKNKFREFAHMKHFCSYSRENGTASEQS